MKTVEPYTYEPHKPITTKAAPWLTRCAFCGLVYLKNDITRWCIKVGCNNRDHPHYRARMAAAGPK